MDSWWCPFGAHRSDYRPYSLPFCKVTHIAISPSVMNPQLVSCLITMKKSNEYEIQIPISVWLHMAHIDELHIGRHFCKTKYIAYGFSQDHNMVKQTFSVCFLNYRVWSGLVWSGYQKALRGHSLHFAIPLWILLSFCNEYYSKHKVW